MSKYPIDKIICLDETSLSIKNNINLDLNESSCPVPPYKKNSVKSKSIISSRTFKSLPLMKTLKDSLKRLSV